MMTVGPPVIQFVRNNQNRATLKFKIKSAVCEIWMHFNGELLLHSNETKTGNDASEISCTMDLLQVRGLLRNDSRVVLDLRNAVWNPLTLSKVEDINYVLKFEIEEFFNKKLKSTDFELARITYEDKLTPSSLVPDRFYLATGRFETSASGYGTLFIFFKTFSSGAAATEQTKRDFNDPLSIDQEIIPNKFDVALFINNRIIFEDIIKEEIKNKFGFEVHTERLPGQSTSRSQQSIYVKGNEGAYRKLKIDNGRSPSFPINIPGNTLTAKPFNEGKKLKVQWRNGYFPARITILVRYWQDSQFGKKSSIESVHQNVKLTTNFVGIFKPSIDKNLTISFTEEAVSGKVDYTRESNIILESVVWGVKEGVESVADTVENELLGIRFNFRSISAFALTQVLFPNKKVFHLTEVYIPGDMLILGTIKTSLTPASN